MHTLPMRERRSIRVKRWLRTHVRSVLRENASPLRTSAGLALGAFIGILPSFLVGTPIAFFLAGRLTLNRAAAVVGTFFTNPLTAPIFYSISTPSRSSDAWAARERFRGCGLPLNHPPLRRGVSGRQRDVRIRLRLHLRPARLCLPSLSGRPRFTGAVMGARVDSGRNFLRDPVQST